MAFELPTLPFSPDALAPHMSAETLSFHHGKHHAKYVNTLNDLLEKAGNTTTDLDQLVRESEGGLFNNAAQHWNHSFFWNCVSPDGGGDPPAKVADALTKAFGSVDAFRDAFTKEAMTHFGSGWAWLVKNADGGLEIVSTHDAGNPLRDGKTPLLTCDVWEHAYYIDHRNDRGAFLKGFWALVNWDTVAARL